MNDNRMIGECRHGKNLATCDLCKPASERAMIPEPTKEEPTIAHVLAAWVRRALDAEAKLVVEKAECERLRKFAALFEANSEKHAAGGASSWIDVLLRFVSENC